MTSTVETRSLWCPDSEADRQFVRQELALILHSPQFSTSRRYPVLLSYVVEKTLVGQADHIKERNLGIEVFHRPADYDSNSDTVVRFTAGEIRKRLTIYYHEMGASSPLRIVVPTGSYVPQFYRVAEEPAGLAVVAPAPVPVPEMRAEIHHEPIVVPGLAPLQAKRRPTALLALAALLAVALAGVAFYLTVLRPRTPLNAFWGPALGDRSSAALICTGGMVVDTTRVSQTNVASKDSPNPLVTLEMASAIANLSGMVQERGLQYRVVPAVSLSIADMRTKPVLLVGAFNNPWTLRLLAPLRFYLAMDPYESILDRAQPGRKWTRNHTVPRAGADDYAIAGRYREAKTDSIIVFAAGVGRNGTEAAAQFLTSPRYMKLLEDRIGGDLARKNIEVVLKTSVVDGHTGASSIEDVYVW